MKVSRNEHAILEQAREAIQRELEEETYERLRKIKKSVLEPVQGVASFSAAGNLDLRKKYVSMSAAEVALAVFTNAEGVFSPKMNKVGDRLIMNPMLPQIDQKSCLSGRVLLDRDFNGHALGMTPKFCVLNLPL